MYADPTLIRKHRVNLSFNDNEAELVNVICKFTGAEKAAFLRQLILDRAQEVLGHGLQSDSSYSQKRDAQSRQFMA